MALNTGLAGAIASVQPNEGLTKPGGAQNANNPSSTKGADFRQALGDALGGSGATRVDPTKLGQVAAQMPTGAARVQPGSSLKFSNHSLERMHSRGITYTTDQMKSIENAVAKAAAKGSKDTLVLTDNSALIVSVKNQTVVTVMDRQTMKDNVFTNIDSTVMA